jgi:hypothetical protein
MPVHFDIRRLDAKPITATDIRIPTDIQRNLSDTLSNYEHQLLLDLDQLYDEMEDDLA